MSKENNRFEIDSSYPGICALCHTEVAEFDGFIQVMEGVFRPRITRLKGNYRMKNVILSNGTIMTVTLCENCINLTPEDCGKLMESEVRGWKKEIDELMLEMVTALKEEHLSIQAQLSITDIPSMGWTEDEKAKISKPNIDTMNLPESVTKLAKASLSQIIPIKEISIGTNS